MKPISVFEHEPIREPLSEADKAALERLRGPSGENMFEVRWREIKATSFVGVVQLGQRVVQVLPKMHRSQLDQQRDRIEGQREATANLLFLLSYTAKLRVTEPEIAQLTRQPAPLSQILFWIFARQLWQAVRRELLRGYVTAEDRLAVLKGRWLVAAQAQRSDGWRPDRFDVAYDEFTEDNLPNRLFKATVLRVAQWASWSDTRSYLAQLRSAFADVAEIRPRREDFPEAAHWMQRYRRRAGEGQTYRPLLELAQMFWTGTGPQPSPGRSDTFAFMFDMNQLFEEFIAEFIRRELREVWRARGWTFHPQSGTRHLLFDESGNNLFKLVPDIRFETETGETALIVDTKYKLIDPAVAKPGVAEADAYQMFAYKERYQCPRVILLYPQAGETLARDFSAGADSPPWLEVRTVNLRRHLIREKHRLREEITDLFPPHTRAKITL
jgi:5-methylcytosine-specific restriction enzyme subunit McrC